MMKKSLILIAFITGYLIMSLELLGGRLLAPYFGYSVYVWGTLIGLILTALSAGYYLGGWLSEYIKGKSKEENPLRFLSFIYFAIILFLLAGLFSYLPVLNYFAGKSIIWGALAATFVLFFVPMILLAAVSPIIIKTLSQTEKIGVSAGLVYAWGTVGSIFGTFLTAFFLIPYLGSRLTFYSCFFLALLLWIMLFLAGSRKQLFLAGFIFLFSLAALLPVDLSKNTILEVESAYNQIRVAEDAGKKLLILNSQENLLAQSGLSDSSSHWVYLNNIFAAGPIIAPVNNLLVLGMAGGFSVLQYEKFFPEIKIDAVEIDSKIIDIAKTNFGVKENENLKIYEADARPFLAQTKKTYDMIEVDLYQGGPQIPFYVLTKEFFKLAFSRLSADGILMMNIYAPENQELLAPALATIGSVFPSVYKIPTQNNVVVLATRSITREEDIEEKLKEEKNKVNADLMPAISLVLNFLETYIPDKKTPVFTDDWAPVEMITYQMIKNKKI